MWGFLIRVWEWGGCKQADVALFFSWRNCSLSLCSRRRGVGSFHSLGIINVSHFTFTTLLACCSSFSYYLTSSDFVFIYLSSFTTSFHCWILRSFKMAAPSHRKLKRVRERAWKEWISTYYVFADLNILPHAQKLFNGICHSSISFPLLSLKQRHPLFFSEHSIII